MSVDNTERHHAKLAGCLYAAHGVYLILAGLGLGVFCWLIPRLLVKVTDSDVIDPERVAPLALGVVEHRNLMPLLAAPSIVIGGISLTKVRPRWLWVGFGLGALLVPAALLLYSFVATVGLLYQVEP
jgi:hypothetical protein